MPPERDAYGLGPSKSTYERRPGPGLARRANLLGREQNIVILVYATSDGRRYLRKERASPAFTGPARETRASLLVDPESLAAADDPETVDRYATEARRMIAAHDPDAVV